MRPEPGRVLPRAGQKDRTRGLRGTSRPGRKGGCGVDPDTRTLTRPRCRRNTTTTGTLSLVCLYTRQSTTVVMTLITPIHPLSVSSPSRPVECVRNTPYYVSPGAPPPVPRGRGSRLGTDRVSSSVCGAQPVHETHTPETGRHRR